MEIVGYTISKAELSAYGNNRIYYPAKLSFNSDTSESSIEYRNNYVLNLLEIFDQEKFKEVEEIRANYNNYITDRNQYDISYVIDFIYRFESCLDNFCIEDVPFENLPYIKRSLNSLLPQELYWHEEKELYDQLNN